MIISIIITVDVLMKQGRGHFENIIYGLIMSNDKCHNQSFSDKQQIVQQKDVTFPQITLWGEMSSLVDYCARLADYSARSLEDRQRETGVRAATVRQEGRLLSDAQHHLTQSSICHPHSIHLIRHTWLCFYWYRAIMPCCRGLHHVVTIRWKHEWHFNYLENHQKWGTVQILQVQFGYHKPTVPSHLRGKYPADGHSSFVTRLHFVIDNVQSKQQPSSHRW